nr:hypothetical protein [uncultured Acetobacterium sp.]
MEKKPEWLKVSYNQAAVDEVSGIMARLKLNTVCKEANCPNLGECYKKRTATFMIMGSICTRHCRFCNVSSGVVEPVDPNEPMHLADAVKIASSPLVRSSYRAEEALRSEPHRSDALENETNGGKQP